MSAAKRGFQVISEEEAPAPQDNTAATKLNTQMLLLALGALSQRAMTAITNLFTVALVASAWFLWHSILINPTTPQLVAVAGYALFCLAIDIVRRRR